MKATLYLQSEVRAAGGRLIRRTRRRPSRSLVRAYLQHLRSAFAPVSEADVVDTGGVARTIRTPAAATTNWMQASISSDDSGILWGTGNAPVDISDYALGALITDGAGAGQLNYGAQAISALATTGFDVQFTQQRVATNNSGASIIVREVGIACITQDTVPATRYFLLARDMEDPGLTVLPGATITTTYTWVITE
ncbi:MAG: hypothetical protein A2V75_09075 [Actinobacteria bacterium RBG_16_70_17]|nr:MAG: hypothetical protein A2V75_09075 [Actinobacteria bacterium RBG_16_70_17]